MPAHMLAAKAPVQRPQCWPLVSCPACNYEVRKTRNSSQSHMACVPEVEPARYMSPPDVACVPAGVADENVAGGDCAPRCQYT